MVRLSKLNVNVTLGSGLHRCLSLFVEVLLGKQRAIIHALLVLSCIVGSEGLLQELLACDVRVGAQRRVNDGTAICLIEVGK